MPEKYQFCQPGGDDDGDSGGGVDGGDDDGGGDDDCAGDVDDGDDDGNIGYFLTNPRTAENQHRSSPPFTFLPCLEENIYD